jgi:hypothetical protein
MRSKTILIQREMQRKIKHYTQKESQKFLRDIFENGGMNKITIGRALSHAAEFGYRVSTDEKNHVIFKFTVLVHDFLMKCKTKDPELEKMNSEIMVMTSPNPDFISKKQAA